LVHFILFLTNMTFKEAKTKANEIGGVVLWWCTYYVETAQEYRNSHGSCHYISRKASKYFKDEYRLEKEERKRKLKDFIKNLKR